ncbi:MAG: MMPL family transporter, partial [Acidimicrobiales bacterium]
SLILAGGSTLSQMGFAVSFGIVVAACVLAMFLTPAITAMIGHRAWWPGHQADRGPSGPQLPGQPVLAGTARGSSEQG